jgi:hypothetical protein
MTTYTSIHYGSRSKRPHRPNEWRAVLIVAYSEDGHALIRNHAIFVDSALSRRLAEAINDAVKPAELITTTRQAGVMAGLVDALWDEDCSLDEAKTLLRAALGEYENRLEDAYQRQQDSLTESGGPDDSAHRKQIVDAGRGHLLR